MIADPDAATAVLERLKALGVRLAIDDFGIGYSSLSQLKALLPVDTLKIDKSFVDGVTGDGEDHAIVDAVLRLAAGARPRGVAEGVETRRAGRGAARRSAARSPRATTSPARSRPRTSSAARDRRARRAHGVVH